MSLRKRSLVTGIAVLAGLLSATGPAAAAATLMPALVADTTFTQVTQDGDNSVKTTLATCPSLCDGNTAGERDAYVEFDVTGLPAGASVTQATLELYSWNPYPARVTAYPAAGAASGEGTWASRPAVGAALATHESVTAGYNAFDVTNAVTGNGQKTFALRQETHNTRVYWASKENSNAALRPRLTVTYETAAGWHLVWQDEFDGSTLDRTKWNARPLTYLDFDKACITDRPDNVFVAGGNLTIRAKREQMTCWNGGGTRQYTTAYLDTIGHADFTYGRFETRAKSPNGPNDSKGLWPAFWLRRTAVSTGGDPNDGNGEIDVMELPGGSQYYKASTSAIFRDYTPTKQDYRYPFPGTTYPGDGFHVYAMEWEPDVLRFYVDGTLISWAPRTPATTPWFDDVFNGNARYHLRLTFHVGGWLGDPDATTAMPADFQVDYVRVYQR
ncbi:DNRLRE domain-containing protein [Actinophytocola sp.]|uniref:DNRLRE domain-containing protein n=1 Tax=Actinophytocola sp. TaxID=1872138 RepID=UPI002ED50596